MDPTSLLLLRLIPVIQGVYGLIAVGTMIYGVVWLYYIHRKVGGTPQTHLQRSFPWIAVVAIFIAMSEDFYLQEIEIASMVMLVARQLSVAVLFILCTVRFADS